MPKDPITFTAEVLLAGTQAAAAVAAALNGGAAAACQEVRLQADPDNGAVDVFVGNVAVQPYQLNAGDEITVRINNVNKIFIQAPAGAPVVNWLAWE